MKKCLLTLLVLLCLLCGCVSSEKAYASGGRYALTYENLEEGKWANAEKGVDCTVYIGRELSEYLTKVTYDVVKLPSVATTLTVSAGHALGAATVLRTGVVAAWEETGSSRDEKYAAFSVHADCCCAFIFTCTIEIQGEEDENYDSEVLYVRNIDSQAPTATLTDSELSGMNLYKKTISVKDSSVVCATSGLSAYTVYRADANKENKEVYATGKSLGHTDTVLVEVEAGEYYYSFVIADSVGNTSEEILIGAPSGDSKAERMQTELSAMKENADRWSANFINRFQAALSAYEVALAKNENVSEAEAALDEVYEEYVLHVALNEMQKADYSIDVINGDYLESTPVFVNGDEAMVFIQSGETAALQIAVGKFDTDKKFKDAQAASGVEQADDVYTFRLQMNSTSGLDIKQSFSEPLRMRFSVGEYESIGAVCVCDGETSVVRVAEYTDGSIELELENCYGDVYLFVDRKTFDARYLWLLTLILPVGGGVFFFVWKIKKKGK